MDVPLVIISGGEPLLQAKGLNEFLNLLPNSINVDIETNGTRPPLSTNRIRNYVTSLKLTNSGVAYNMRIVDSSIEALNNTGRATWKFVVYQHSDLDEVDKLVAAYGLRNVWIMPAGTTADMILGVAKRIAPSVASRGYNFTLRQHVLLYGETRGV